MSQIDIRLETWFTSRVDVRDVYFHFKPVAYNPGQLELDAIELARIIHE